MRQILLTNGIVIDPANGIEGEFEVLLGEGKVLAVGTGLRGQAPDAEIIDCGSGAGGAVTGGGRGKMLVVPGLVDIHVHFREPGQEAKETILTGSRAAVAGGFTTVCCMPNTVPALDDETQIEFVYTKAREAGLCRVLPIGAITKGRKGQELAEMGLMYAAGERSGNAGGAGGAVGFSDDGIGVGSAAVMLKALQYVKMLGSVLTQHCEEPSLSGGPMTAGAMAVKLGLGGLPAAAEELMIARDLLLNQRVGARYHVQHISTAGAVELVRRAKKNGENVTCEVTPHHLLLTDEACGTLNGGYDTHTKMNPPLRGPADVEACIAGLVDGTIDCVATDHAPHTREEKELEFDKAPFGIVGLETAVGLYARALVDSGKMQWGGPGGRGGRGGLIEKMTSAPARVMGLGAGLKGIGSLSEGAPADVTVIDPGEEWVIDADRGYSKGCNTPFGGWRVKGKVKKTICGGRVVFDGIVKG